MFSSCSGSAGEGQPAFLKSLLTTCPSPIGSLGDFRYMGNPFNPKSCCGSAASRISWFKNPFFPRPGNFFLFLLPVFVAKRWRGD
jgi:hypothetical protein